MCLESVGLGRVGVRWARVFVMIPRVCEIVLNEKEVL